MNQWLQTLRDRVFKSARARREFDAWAARHPAVELDAGRPKAERENPLDPRMEDGRLVLSLYSAIGYDSFFRVGLVGPQDFVDAFKGRADADVDVLCDCVGGDVYATRAITALMGRHKGAIKFHVDGLAASAATILMCAADERIANRGSRVMIHQTWGVVIGNADDLRDVATDLDGIDRDVADDYARIGGKTSDEFLAMMQAETWLSPAQAKDCGLVDDVLGASEADGEEPDAPAADSAARLRALEVAMLSGN